MVARRVKEAFVSFINTLIKQSRAQRMKVLFAMGGGISFIISIITILTRPFSRGQNKQSIAPRLQGLYMPVRL